MKFYLAPMEGLTGYVVRNAFYHHFDCFDTYFSPFIPAAKRMYSKTRRDVDPENNKGIILIPQLMSNRADEIIDLANQLAAYGYRDLNINLGCPSGTVANKGRGSGFLAYPDELERCLDEVYRHTDFTLSVKTRIGFHDTDQWERILQIYHKYPTMPELIIHPRTQTDFYKAPVRPEFFDRAMEVFSDSRVPLCYNGEINSLEDYLALKKRWPNLDRVMIGRGAFRFPGLVSRLREYEAASGQPLPPVDALRYRKQLKSFCDEIEQAFLDIYSGEKDALFRMKEIWTYLAESFVDSDKYLKKIRKSQHLDEYHLVVASIFRDLELNLDPFQ